MKRRLTPIVVVAVLVAAALLTWAIRVGTTSPGGRVFRRSEERPPNIVVIVMDTARQDRLSLYGYERDTSPRLRELAAESTVFGRAWSTSSWTSPSHASLFTGLYPASHGVTQENWRMSREAVTLAEILSENGYETLGIVENGILSNEHGFHQGFGDYHVTSRAQRMLDNVGAGGRSETGNHATDLFLKSLRERETASPFFVFVNLIAPHQPYDSSKQFIGEYLTNPDVGLADNMWPEYYLGRKRFTAEELRHLNELYDAELLYTDHLVGLMADGLKAAGLWEETLFIVTSDHGENIGDHKHMDHVFSLYETTVKVPLLIHDESRFPAGAVDDRPVTLVDLFPTLLEAAGVDRDSHPSQGLSLLSDEIPEDRAIVAEYYWPVQALGRYSEEDRSSARLDAFRRRLRSITVEDTKLVWGSDGSHELYDLSSDPEELEDLLSAADAPETEELERRLAETIARFESEVAITPASVRADDLDPDTREALRSLGYIQ